MRSCYISESITLSNIRHAELHRPRAEQALREVLPVSHRPETAEFTPADGQPYGMDKALPHPRRLTLFAADADIARAGLVRIFMQVSRWSCMLVPRYAAPRRAGRSPVGGLADPPTPLPE